MPRPKGYKYEAPKRASLKAKSKIFKIIKDSDNFNEEYLKDLLNRYYFKYEYNLGDDIAHFFNNPDSFHNVGEKAKEKIQDNFESYIRELYESIPEVAHRIKEEKIKKDYIESAKDLARTHFQYNHAQYAFDSNEYEVNQNRAVFENMIDHFARKYKDEDSQFFIDLYHTLENKNNFVFETTGEESISTYSHISSWRFWARGFIILNGEYLGFDNVSYRDSEHNRV